MNKLKHFNGGLLFAGANSGHGFVSFYDDMLGDSVKRIYILKGGPGTGKSSFLRAAAEYASQKGYSVEYYSCSSDPDSLDAILVDGETAILDGTAPHVWEPSMAGAREEIVNLGQFWDSQTLAEHYCEISELSAKKSECYRRAYKYLEAAKKVNDIDLSLVMPYVKTKKAEKAVERIFSEIVTGGGFEVLVGMIDSVGMKGRVRHDTYEFFAEKIYVLEDYLGIGALYLRLLIAHARLTDTPLRVSYDPIDPDLPNAVFFTNDNKAFVVSEKEGDIVGDVKINMKRFIDTAGVGKIKREYKMNKKLAAALISSATDALAEAGKHHFDLEEIYTSCMDFEAKEAYCNELLIKIFG